MEAITCQNEHLDRAFHFSKYFTFWRDSNIMAEQKTYLTTIMSCIVEDAIMKIRSIEISVKNMHDQWDVAREYVAENERNS